MADLSDAALVEATMRGDQVAYASLFERHSGAVRTAVRGHIGSDPDAIEDAVQESFTRALSRLDSLRDPSRFRPWLMQIARNAATDVRRLNTRVDHEPIEESGGEGVVLTTDRTGPDTEVELREMAHLVRGCVAGLTPRDATAISMVLWLGFGPQDVAAALGITPGAAKVLLHRARRRLRDALIVEIAGAARSFACTGLSSLIEAGDDLAAARHLKDCQTCIDASRAHVGLDAGAH
ncbi:MAG: RNA polymerase sigma factor [Acidimicrobiales bacterium]